MSEVAVYRGDEMLCTGTVQECAKKMKVLPETIRFYTTPTYRKRLALRKNGRYQDQLIVVKI